MSKKIVLSGAFYGTNFGDHLFAMLLSSAIGERCVLKNASAEIVSDTKVPSVRLGAVLTAAGVVFGPGGYFGEGPQDTLRKRISRLRHHYLPAVLARWVGTPYIVVGVGVGPLKGRVTRRMLRYVMEGAVQVSVRDQESLAYLRQCGVESRRILMGSDSAIAFPYVLPGVYTDSVGSMPTLGDSAKRRVFLHVEPKASSSLTRVWDDCLAFLLDRNCDVVLGTDFLYDEVPSIPFVRNALNSNPDRVSVATYRNPLGLINVLRDVDSVITHKLHVGILGCALGRAVVSFPVHPKTSRFYRQIDESSRCLPVESAMSGVATFLDANWEREVRLSDAVVSSSRMHFEVVEQFVSAVSK